MDWHHVDGRRYVPLYEAKMIHHFDHRWATYEGLDGVEKSRDVTFDEKKNTNFEPTPRYWVPEEEVDLRASRIPSRLKATLRSFRTRRSLFRTFVWTAKWTDLIRSTEVDVGTMVRTLRAAIPREERPKYAPHQSVGLHCFCLSRTSVTESVDEATTLHKMVESNSSLLIRKLLR